LERIEVERRRIEADWERIEVERRLLELEIRLLGLNSTSLEASNNQRAIEIARPRGRSRRPVQVGGTFTGSFSWWSW
jgi:hypothetical protein